MLRSQKIKIEYDTEKKFKEMSEEVEGFRAILMQQAEDYLSGVDPLMQAQDI